MSTPRLFRALFQRATAAFTNANGPRIHRWSQHQQRYKSHSFSPIKGSSLWRDLTLRGLMAFTAAARPFKPQIVTTRCYSRRVEDTSPLSSASSSPSASPHEGPFRRWSPMLGLIPISFYASNSSDDDDKCMNSSNSPSTTSQSPSSYRLRGRTGSSPLDFVRMRLKDMEPEEEEHSPQESSPIIPIRGYDKTSNIWSRRGSSSKLTTFQFELEDDEEMISSSHNTPIPSFSKPTPTSSSHFASHVDSKGHLVVRASDVPTMASWHTLTTFLSQSPHITSLRLQGMSLLPCHIELLGSQALRYIHNLTLVDNNLGVTMDTWMTLIPLLRSYPQLESLSLIRQSLTDEHIALIIPWMITQTCLTHVSLAWNGIGDPGAKKLSLALRQVPNMSKVDLSYNTIGTRGSDALSLTQQQIHRTGRNLTINLKHNQSCDRIHHMTWPQMNPTMISHQRSASITQSNMSLGSLTASDMLGVMNSDITTSMIPRSQPIAIPTPSTTNTSSFERHVMSSMALH